MTVTDRQLSDFLLHQIPCQMERISRVFEISTYIGSLWYTPVTLNAATQGCGTRDAAVVPYSRIGQTVRPPVIAMSLHLRKARNRMDVASMRQGTSAS